MRNYFARFPMLVVVLFLSAASVFISGGCTVNSNGMQLPSGYYLKDKVEYYPQGPRYQFSEEATYLQNATPDANVSP
jgi:hypothetical protein